MFQHPKEQGIFPVNRLWFTSQANRIAISQQPVPIVSSFYYLRLPLTCHPSRSMTGLDHPLSLPNNPTLVNIPNEQAGEANDKDAGTDPNGQGSMGV